MPAPAINGFFISGPGAELPPLEVPAIACQPEAIHTHLISQGYIWERRWSCSDATSISEFIIELKQEVTQKTELMWNLSRDYGTQFNFLLLRTIDAINCLIYPYVRDIVEGKTNKYFHEIRDLFSHLDDAHNKLVKTLRQII